MGGQAAKKKKKTSSGKTMRKSRGAKVKTFTLSNEERLELENLQLKEGAIRDRLAQVTGQQQEWGKAVQAKYGVELQEFVINPDTGVCERRELKEVPNGGSK